MMNVQQYEDYSKAHAAAVVAFEAAKDAVTTTYDDGGRVDPDEFGVALNRVYAEYEFLYSAIEKEFHG